MVEITKEQAFELVSNKVETVLVKLPTKEQLIDICNKYSIDDNTVDEKIKNSSEYIEHWLLRNCYYKKSGSGYWAIKLNEFDSDVLYHVSDNYDDYLKLFGGTQVSAIKPIIYDYCTFYNDESIIDEEFNLLFEKLKKKHKFICQYLKVVNGGASKFIIETENLKISHQQKMLFYGLDSHFANKDLVKDMVSSDDSIAKGNNEKDGDVMVFWFFSNDRDKLVERTKDFNSYKAYR